jgi:hypothetical protein
MWQCASFRSRRRLPHRTGDVAQDVIQLPLENHVEPRIAAHGLELAAIDRLTIHHDFLLQLLTDAFEPAALRLGLWPAGENGLHRCPETLTMRQQWLSQRNVPNVTDD